MNDITKARAFLRAIDSDLQHLASFGLMLATAEQRYRDIQLRKRSNNEWSSLDEKELTVTLDYAVLRYMKRTNRLPGNVTEAFAPGVTAERKQELIISWMNG